MQLNEIELGYVKLALIETIAQYKEDNSPALAEALMSIYNKIKIADTGL